MDGVTTSSTQPGPARSRTDGPARSPGRPRSARADEAILEAVLDLLQEGVAVDALSIEAVAARAGVGKATIYRRWSNKESLLVDAVRRLKGAPPDPEGASVRDDLIMLLTVIGRRHDSRAMRVLPCLMPEVLRNPVQYRLYQEVIEPRREVMREVLRRGVRTGELRPDLDVEVALATITGPLLIQKLLRWNPAIDDEKLPARVVDTILAGIGGA
ncbi:MAG TPA: TetR/AcrR family transcriptional regulator [Micromonosporaceae bacterium]|nr:TetR/AcrR family transcriptional regulator [Micromonosporaceae bacterium]